MGVGVGSPHVVSAAPSSSGRTPHSSPNSSVGYFPWEMVLHELLQHESFPRAAVLHELLQSGSLPRGAVLQEWTAPAWVPRGVTSPARKTCSSVGSPQGHSLLREPTCSGVGSSTGCRWISAPLWTSMDCRGTASSSSGAGLLTLFPCSSVGSLPQETVLHELLQR